MKCSLCFRTTECPVCFALVTTARLKDHRDWHETVKRKIDMTSLLGPGLQFGQGGSV